MSEPVRDVLVRAVPLDVLTRIDGYAGAVGLTRAAYIRRLLDAMARPERPADAR